MVSRLCLQTQALRVTLLAEFAAEQSHEMAHSESQNPWLFKALSQAESWQKLSSPQQQWQNWTCPGAADAQFHSPIYHQPTFSTHEGKRTRLQWKRPECRHAFCPGALQQAKEQL